MGVLKNPSLPGRVAALLGSHGLPARFPPMRMARVLEAARRDKKARGGRVRMVLPVRAGRVVVLPVPLATLKAVL